MVIYHLDTGGGWANALRAGSLVSPSHSSTSTQCPAGHLPSSLSSSCLVWGRDRAPQTQKEGVPGSAQSWASQNNGILVENLRCYHEKLMEVYCSRVWALLSVYDCYNSLLRSKHPIRPLLPSYSENRNEDWIGSKLPTVIGRIEKSETDTREFIRSLIHFTNLYCISSHAKNYFARYNDSGERNSLYSLSMYCARSITSFSPIC